MIQLPDVKRKKPHRNHPLNHTFIRRTVLKHLRKRENEYILDRVPHSVVPLVVQVVSYCEAFFHSSKIVFQDLLVSECC